MLQVAIRRINPDHLNELRDWLATVQGTRQAEALATLSDEGCRHEQAYVVSGADGPILIQVMEVENVARSQEAAATSTHLIDADHQRVMNFALGEDINAELLLDLRLAE